MSVAFCNCFPSFFVDSNNSVLALGNPVYNSNVREFGIGRVEKKLVISPTFCIFIVENQNTTKRTSDDYQGQGYRVFLYY